MVESADPATGKDVGGREVQHQWINHDDDLLDVTVRGTVGKPATLHTTANHPFWDDTAHTWVAAGSLTVGDSLNTNTNTHVKVLALRTTPGAADRYNLTVTQLHTYYVLAGQTPILVHNAGGGTCPTNLQSGNSPAAAAGTAVHNGTEWGEHLDSLGYSRGHQVSPGNIPDGFTADGFPVELKPNTRSGIKAGTRQLRRYMNQMGVDYGELWTYRNTPDGVVFDLVATPRSGSRRWNRW